MLLTLNFSALMTVCLLLRSTTLKFWNGFITKYSCNKLYYRAPYRPELLST